MRYRGRCQIGISDVVTWAVVTGQCMTCLMVKMAVGEAGEVG
jgi:hypothetical protein